MVNVKISIVTFPTLKLEQQNSSIYKIWSHFSYTIAFFLSNNQVHGARFRSHPLQFICIKTNYLLLLCKNVPFWPSRERIVLESPQFMNRKCFGVISKAVQVVPDLSLSSRNSWSNWRKAAWMALARESGSYFVSSTFYRTFRERDKVIIKSN